MEPLALKPRQPVEDIECWDDDDDLEGDAFHFRSTSIASTLTMQTPTSAHTGPHRESISSRLSTRSDLESNGTGDEERHLLLPEDDEDSTMDAIASANNAGIPIPSNVPSSALLGGTIKRLGGKKVRKALQDDWSEDLDIPVDSSARGLQIKKRDGPAFPDTLRQFSIGSPSPKSPGNPSPGMSFAVRMGLQSGAGSNVDLDRFRDSLDDDIFGDGDDVATIKVAKNPALRKAIDFTPPQSTTVKEPIKDDFEDDLELPEHGQPLTLSNRREVTKTPAPQQDEFDEWAEGSLGTRHGGTKRDFTSNRSSSLSAMSPSVSSSFTAESEDEGLDGLVLPEGPIRFDDILKKRKQNASPDLQLPTEQSPDTKRAATKEDFFSGLEIGDGDVFDSGKLTLNRNVKHKPNRTTSPTRRTAVTLKFTNKPVSTNSRIPVPTLEPVSESGGPVVSSRRMKSRSSGHHSANSSLSSIPTPSLPSTPCASRTPVPLTPSRQRELGSRISMKNLRSEPTTTNAQLLKMKRSMPTMNALQNSPAKPPSGHYRPPSRSESSRSQVPMRPKTPIDRSGADSSLGQSRKPPLPFLPAGASVSRSHYTNSRASRTSRRHDSESSTASTDALGRPVSRIGARSRQNLRSPSPVKRKDVAPEGLAREAAAKRTLTRPARRRNFGDGNELEIFDDLPTSVNAESKFVKVPIGRGAPKAMRSKLGIQTQAPYTRSETPLSARPFSPIKGESTPRFARDTNASRIAREQRAGPVGTNPLAQVSGNWRAQLPPRAPTALSGAHIGIASPSAARGRRKREIQQKPHLIKPLGDTHTTPKSVKGMNYNPDLFRWEGNENALAPFDAPLPAPKDSPPPSASRLDAAHRPALITNINAASPTIQVVGGMVFDPQRMCWLKLSHQQPPSDHNPTSPSSFAADPADDSDDPFAGLDDLDDDTFSCSGKRDSSVTTHSKGGAAGKRVSQHGIDEWLVGEEFDVGPEFVRRQRDEEDRWEKKVASWIGGGVGERESEAWRWAIRDVAPSTLD